MPGDTGDTDDAGGHVAVVTGDQLQVWRVTSDSGHPAPKAVQVGGCELPHPEAQVYSLATSRCMPDASSSMATSQGGSSSSGSRLFAGDSRGRLTVFDWQPGGSSSSNCSSSSAAADPKVLRELVSESDWPIVDVLQLGYGGGAGGGGGPRQVACLHDSTFMLQHGEAPWASGNCVRLWDVEAGRGYLRVGV